MHVAEALLRMYNVGFGDCFLLRLTYDDAARSTRSVLFDFGSTKLPDGARSDHMERIARNIDLVTGGKLHLVVATHRHADHISGFGHASAGPIIERLAPELVVQPWTEDPDLATDAVAPTSPARAGRLALARTLTNMQAFAAGAHAEGLRLQSVAGFPTSVAERLSFLGETNLSNRAAVECLMRLGRRRVYAKFGDTLDVAKLLPGVRVEVLGPPTLEQAPAIARQARTDAQEFWHLAGVWGRAAAAGNAPGEPPGAALPQLFPGVAPVEIPQAAKWLVPQVTRAHAEDMLSILRTMDDVLNNTSLILLVEIGGTRLLFPGDAQLENWSYALFDAPTHTDIQARLADTHVYKVGHHGSLNATPKTLWRGFSRRQPKIHADDSRLISVMSTKSGKHGDARRGTEVPRRKLVDALELESTLVTTLGSRALKEPWKDVPIPIQ